MLLRLKISVHNIEVAPPKVPKGSPDYDLHVLIRAIGLYHLPVLFLCRCTEHLFWPFTRPRSTEHSSLQTTNPHSSAVQPLCARHYASLAAA